MALLSGIIKNNNLISEADWINHISSLKISELFDNKQAAIKYINESLENAIKKRMPSNHFGILFSGGVDSTFIAFLCKKLGGNFTCYTVGIEGSKDVVEAEKVAKELDFKQKCKILNNEEIEEYFKKVIKILGETNVVNVGVGATALAAIELGEKDGVDSFFSGLGSEEIFAGYERHSKAQNINDECWSGLKGMWKKDLLRDYAIGKHENIDLLVPFLDEDVIKTAMRVPGEWKISGEHKKMILREAAIKTGMPELFAMRKKVAAQYGSGIDKVMERLAKKKRIGKAEYLKSLAP
ncbi:MAG: asparagine synthase-related protein [Nanoarchaeota archaeon]